LEEKPPSLQTAYPDIQQIVDRASTRVANDVAKIRARGGNVVFVRFPASGPAYSSEARSFPRSLSWEPLLHKTGATGVNFADHPQLQGYNLPEWSHMSAADAPRFTQALAGLIVRCIAHPDSKETPPAGCATKGSDFTGRYGYR
jgi:hypothetical protein